MHDCLEQKAGKRRVAESHDVHALVYLLSRIQSHV